MTNGIDGAPHLKFLKISHFRCCSVEGIDDIQFVVYSFDPNEMPLAIAEIDVCNTFRVILVKLISNSLVYNDSTCFNSYTDILTILTPPTCCLYHSFK